MTIKTLPVRISSLNFASFRVVSVRDARGLVYLMRRDISTLRGLYAQPFLAAVTAPRRGRIRSSANLRPYQSHLSTRKRQHD